MESQASLGVRLLKIASIYLLVALLLGFVMAVSKDYSLVSVHSHIALLGWIAMAVTGLVYLALPRLVASRLAAVHFWLQNIGLPIMMGSLAWAVIRADPGVEPAIGVGSVLVIGGLLAFAINLFTNGKREPAGGR